MEVSEHIEPIRALYGMIEAGDGLWGGFAMGGYAIFSCHWARSPVNRIVVLVVCTRR